MRYPIVQTGMGWVSKPELTAATSEAGGFGILAAATLTFEELQTSIADIKARTSNPFGVNMRADQPGVEKVVDLLVAEGVTLASFAGAPKPKVIDRLKAGGVLTMPTVGARRHAEKVAALGVDAMIAQGGEGGGHTGSVPTTLLLPEVVDAVDVPVLGAGGFGTGQGLVAALAYGADGIAMGTRFLLTRESPVPDAVKQIYLGTKVTGTVVTKAIDGAPQRVVATEMVSGLERSSGLSRMLRAFANALRLRKITQTALGDLVREAIAMKRSRGLTWAQVAMAANAPMLTRASMVDGRTEVGILPTGQVVGTITELPSVADLIARIVTEANDTLERLSAPADTPADAS